MLLVGGTILGVLIIGLFVWVALRSSLKTNDQMSLEGKSGDEYNYKHRAFDIIMALASVSPEITNDGVAKALRIKPVTAMQYLGELEQKGRIVQSGRTGNTVTYRKVS